MRLRRKPRIRFNDCFTTSALEIQRPLDWLFARCSSGKRLSIFRLAGSLKRPVSPKPLSFVSVRGSAIAAIGNCAGAGASVGVAKGLQLEPVNHLRNLATGRCFRLPKNWWRLIPTFSRERRNCWMSTSEQAVEALKVVPEVYLSVSGSSTPIALICINAYW